MFNAPDGAHKGKLTLKRDGDDADRARSSATPAEYQIEGTAEGGRRLAVVHLHGGRAHPDHDEGDGQGGHDERARDLRQRPGRLDRDAGRGGRRAGCARRRAALDISGAWVFEVDHGGRFGDPGGDVQAEWGDADRPVLGQLGEAPIQGTLKGNELTFSFDVTVQDTQDAHRLQRTAAKDAMKGTVTLGELGEGTFTARRK